MGLPRLRCGCEKLTSNTILSNPNGEDKTKPAASPENLRPSKENGKDKGSNKDEDKPEASVNPRDPESESRLSTGASPEYFESTADAGKPKRGDQAQH